MEPVWKGRRIFTSKWARQATTPQTNIPAYKLAHGYLWWISEYPYKGRNIRAYFASGNGGQLVLVIPDLDVVMAFYGSNYNDAGGRSRNIYVPQYILPAIEE